MVSKRGRVGKDMTAGYAVPLTSRGGRSGAGGWVGSVSSWWGGWLGSVSSWWWGGGEEGGGDGV